MGNLVIFGVWLLNNWLVNVAETFTNILKYYVLQTTANKFAKCMLYRTTLKTLVAMAYAVMIETDFLLLISVKFFWVF